MQADEGKSPCPFATFVFTHYKASLSQIPKCEPEIGSATSNSNLCADDVCNREVFLALLEETVYQVSELQLPFAQFVVTPQ
jgi:hypothetical protein